MDSNSNKPYKRAINVCNGRISNHTSVPYASYACDIKETLFLFKVLFNTSCGWLSTGWLKI